LPLDEQPKNHIFISYSKKQKAYARAFADYLIQNGFDVWIDDRIEYGENWWNAIVQAIEGCGALAVIMSPEAKSSRWVQREVQLADEWAKPTFPLLLAGANWPLFVLTQYIDVQGGKLPGPDFIERLAEVAPRRAAPGREVTASPAVVATGERPRLTAPRRRIRLAAAGVLMIAAALGTAAIANGWFNPDIPATAAVNLPTQPAITPTFLPTAAPENTSTPAAATLLQTSTPNPVDVYQVPAAYDTFWSMQDKLGLPDRFDVLPVKTEDKLILGGFGPSAFAFRYWRQWYSRISGLHNGFDYIVKTGTPLLAVCNGLYLDGKSWPFVPPTDKSAVLWCFLPDKYKDSQGNPMMSNVLVAYAHMSDNTSYKKELDVVRAGEIIGLSGTPSGQPGNDHLHLEVHLLEGDTHLLQPNTSLVDPINQNRKLKYYPSVQPFGNRTPWNPLLFFSYRLVNSQLKLLKQTAIDNTNLRYPTADDLQQAGLPELPSLGPFSVAYFEYGAPILWSQKNSDWPEAVYSVDMLPQRLQSFTAFEPYSSAQVKS
jgi:murein DD-endopeptidase MepM/ murein hydrolase activator NlpD